MEIYYENSKHEKIDLECWPVVIQEKESLFKNSWKYESRAISDSGGKIVKFYKEIGEKTIKLSIFADTKEEYKQIMKKMVEVMEYDVYNMQQGKLHVGTYYLPCYVVGADYSGYEELFYCIEKNLTIVAENPQWIKEKSFRFRSGIQTEEGKNLNYPYNYPYNYINSLLNEVIDNENTASCNFEMIIYGQCSNPSILIGNHYYNVNSVIGTGEYLKINSRTKKIEKHKINGDIESEFDKRNRDYDIFQKINAGRKAISWSGMFGFDLVLYEERSEPVWI